MRMGLVEADVSYCSSKNRPAREAIGVVAVFVVVSASKTYAARESLLDKGVDDFLSRAVR
jgi:hypothetical protein